MRYFGETGFLQTSLITMTYGFLPAEAPHFLPEHNELAVLLNKLIRDLPIYLTQKTLKKTIDALDSKFSNTTLVLETKNEKIGAKKILSFLTQAYIFESPDKKNNIIPAVLSRNISAVCRDLQVYPIITYSDYVLQNWRLLDPAKGFEPENIKPHFTFTGSPQEEWFIQIHVAIEMICSKAISLICEATSINAQMQKSPHMKESLEKKLISALNDITPVLNEASKLLLRIKENLTPDFFFNTMRLFLMSWEEKFNIQFSGTKGTHQYKGPSGAQSTIFPALDAAFGIKHDVDGMYQHLLTFHQYMPVKDHHLLLSLKLNPIEISNKNSLALNNSVEKAIYAVKRFRFVHYTAIVERFIHRPASVHGILPEQITGTGGSPIGTYLENRFLQTGPKKHEMTEKAESELIMRSHL